MVAFRNVSGIGKVLTAGDGHTLYTAEQERSGKLSCTSACTTIWKPLTVVTGQQPSAPSSVRGKLSTVTRPNGLNQVTLNGAPLYTFSLDHAAGQTNGNGAKDSFNGVHFTWHAATATGAAAPAQTNSSGSGY
jgi:predicted lipoprotein with Yx(FWY)xxD motif